MPEEKLADRLEATRDGFDEERVWHKFLLDAYSGCGGFSGRVKQPDTDWLGWATGMYSDACSSTTTSYTSQSTTLPDGTVITGQTTLQSYETYLDAFPREDAAKFQRRMHVAHYVNYVGPICDLFAGYLNSAPPSREGVEDGSELAGWMQDADGRGTSWDELKETVIVPRALQLGWCPVLFDADAPPEEVTVTSKAQEKQLQLGTRAIPLFPANVLEWQVDDSGALKWVKIKIDYCERPDPLGDEVEYSKVWIWTAETVSAWRIEGEGKNRGAEELFKDRPHKFGAVPLIVFRAAQSPDNPVCGMSAIGAVAIENRRHFNALSELDEHLRSTVFALLQVPIPEGATAPDQLLTGNGNAVPVPASASQGYGFIAPPQSVADTYENRLSASVREIYRIAQAPFEADSGVPTSGIAYAYKFEGTNKRLVKIAKGLCSAEQRALQLVGSSLGMADTDAIRISPPAGFLVNDISVDLDNLIKAIGLNGMSATAKMIAISRAVQKMLPNMKAEDRAKIEAELAQLREADLQAAAPTDKGTVGAQTDAIIKVNDEINSKQIPHETGVNIVVKVMGLSPEEAATVLVPKGFVAAPKVPAAPFGQKPPADGEGDGNEPPPADDEKPSAEDDEQQQAA